MTRLRSTSNPARPYIWRFKVFSRWIWSGRPPARCHRWPFSVGPPPNGACLFPGTPLSSCSFRVALSRRPSRVDGQVTVPADDQRLALHRGHAFDPGGPPPAPLGPQIGKPADVVDLDLQR